MTDELKGGVLKLLRSYRLTMTEDGEGNGYPLVDAITPPGDTAITRGIEELEYLAEDIASMVSEAQFLGGRWTSFDAASPEGPNLVQQYLGDSVLDHSDPPFWAFPTSRWHGTKQPYATHWRYVDAPVVTE